MRVQVRLDQGESRPEQLVGAQERDEVVDHRVESFVQQDGQQHQQVEDHGQEDSADEYRQESGVYRGDVAAAIAASQGADESGAVVHLALNVTQKFVLQLLQAHAGEVRGQEVCRGVTRGRRHGQGGGAVGGHAGSVIVTHGQVGGAAEGHADSVPVTHGHVGGAVGGHADRTAVGIRVRRGCDKTSHIGVSARTPLLSITAPLSRADSYRSPQL